MFSTYEAFEASVRDAQREVEQGRVRAEAWALLNPLLAKYTGLRAAMVEEALGPVVDLIADFTREDFD